MASLQKSIRDARADIAAHLEGDDSRVRIDTKEVAEGEAP